MTRRKWLAAATAATASAQQDPVIRVDVRLVRLLVTVKNEAGELVGSLDRNDFTLRDSGVEQELAIFERHTELPLSVALLVDTSGSTAKDLKYEIEASTRFLQALVKEGNPKDALALYSFNHDVTLQMGFTRNAGRVRKTLQQLRAEAGTSIYDALTFAADLLENRQGRRVIVVVTDGGDTTSVRTYHEALREVHSSDVVIYPIVVVPIENDAGRNLGGEHALITLSRSTGGRAFFPTIGPELDAAFTGILRDLRTQYLLCYYPKNLPALKEKFRRVRVELKQAGLQPSTRDGYYEE